MTARSWGTLCLLQTGDARLLCQRGLGRPGAAWQRANRRNAEPCGACGIQRAVPERLYWGCSFLSGLVFGNRLPREVVESPSSGMLKMSRCGTRPYGFSGDGGDSVRGWNLMILEVFSKLSDSIDLRCCVKLRVLLLSSFGEYEAVGSGRAFGRGPVADSLFGKPRQLRLKLPGGTAGWMFVHLYFPDLLLKSKSPPAGTTHRSCACCSALAQNPRIP